MPDEHHDCDSSEPCGLRNPVLLCKNLSIRLVQKALFIHGTYFQGATRTLTLAGRTLFVSRASSLGYAIPNKVICCDATPINGALAAYVTAKLNLVTSL